jgi:hypothetical protein
MNRSGFGRKRSCRSLRYYHWISVEGPKETIQIIRVIWVLTDSCQWLSQNRSEAFRLHTRADMSWCHVPSVRGTKLNCCVHNDCDIDASPVPTETLPQKNILLNMTCGPPYIFKLSIWSSYDLSLGSPTLDEVYIPKTNCIASKVGYAPLMFANVKAPSSNTDSYTSIATQAVMTLCKYLVLWSFIVVSNFYPFPVLCRSLQLCLSHIGSGHTHQLFPGIHTGVYQLKRALGVSKNKLLFQSPLPQYFHIPFTFKCPAILCA